MLSFHDGEIISDNLRANQGLRVDQSNVYVQANCLHFICTDNNYKDLVSVQNEEIHKTQMTEF